MEVIGQHGEDTRQDGSGGDVLYVGAAILCIPLMDTGMDENQRGNYGGRKGLAGRKKRGNGIP